MLFEEFGQVQTGSNRFAEDRAALLEMFVVASLPVANWVLDALGVDAPAPMVATSKPLVVAETCGTIERLAA